MIETELLCHKCLQIKTVENFYPKRDAKRVRKYQSRCKDCARTNTAKYKSENLMLVREQCRKNYIKNSQRIIFSKRMSNIKRLQRVPLWLSEFQKKEMENFYWLAKDLEKVTGGIYHVDHIVPLQGKNVCGLHVPWNLQVLPADINMKKSNFFEGGQ